MFIKLRKAGSGGCIWINTDHIAVIWPAEKGCGYFSNAHAIIELALTLPEGEDLIEYQIIETPAQIVAMTERKAKKVGEA